MFQIDNFTIVQLLLALVTGLSAGYGIRSIKQGLTSPKFKDILSKNEFEIISQTTYLKDQTTTVYRVARINSKNVYDITVNASGKITAIYECKETGTN